MRKFKTVLLFLIIGILFAYSWQGREKIDVKSIPVIRGDKPLNVSPDYGNTPLYFIPNKGQVHKQALFYAKAAGYTLWLTREGLVFDSLKRLKGRGERSKVKGERLSYAPERDASRLMFVGANINPEIVPVDNTQHKVNYFIGKDKTKWQQNIPTSAAVLYKNIYKNIDLKVYGSEKQVEYDWIVKPGGNPEAIWFKYQDVKSTHIDRQGNLIIKTDFGELIHKRPVSFQVVGKETGEKSRVVVDVEFEKKNKNTYGFAVGEYDKSRELIIDPVVQLDYSTYLGGGRDDRGFAIAVDSSGCAYVSGITTSKGFPIKNPFQSQRIGTTYNVFITKLAPGGNALEYSTYLGGSHSDRGGGIAVDHNGCTYITGNTYSKDFPTENPFQAKLKGDYDAFITKLSAEGNSILYSSFLGGRGKDYGNSIALDKNGCAYITGITQSRDFPTKNPYQEIFKGGGEGRDCPSDAFVTKLNADGSSLSYSTFLGGRNYDTGEGIAVDSNGNAYVTGTTKSADFPTTGSSFQPYRAGLGKDTFVTKLLPGGTSLSYSTLLGGTGHDYGKDIAIDQNGNAYITGCTTSLDFPIKNPYQSNGNTNYYDTYVTKLSADGSALSYSTYLCHGGYDMGFGIEVDKKGNAYVTGYSGVTSGYFTSYPSLFVTKFSPDGSKLDYNLSIHMTEGGDIALDRDGYAYVTGTTYKRSPFPTRNAFQKKFGGGLADRREGDAFVMKLVDDYPPTITIISPDDRAVVSGTVVIRADADDDLGMSRVDFYIDDELIGSDKQVPYEFDWESFRTANGNHKIKAEAVDTEDHKTADEITVKTQNLILNLKVERKVEQSWLIKKEFAQIDFNVKNPGKLVVKKYIFYRKESGGKYQPIKEIPGADLSSGNYSFNDTYLEKDKTYYYKIEALDSSGDIIGASEEQAAQQSRSRKKIIIINRGK